jgi:transcriptional regulator with XRE-family HTH domain
MLYTAQIKAARSLLGWKQNQLAKAAGVGIATLQRIEKSEGPASGNYSTVLKIQAALEKAGIEFTDEEGVIGVRLKRPRPLTKSAKGK